ncbi:MAG: 3-deoxy-D-manno-octulosonic acid transferase [Holosporales bacterium]|jgi:3-deoxy-D-manno-octulosonic-acid transferase|nr:3-deoxy-D-manno-octulosonic acid transferase [Holosporales bacterium]
MLFIFYKYLSLLLAPVILAYSFIKSIKYDDRNKRLKNHRGIATMMRPSGKLIWMHAASVGETLTAITLFKHLKKGGGAKILITTSTKTAADLLKSRIQACPALNESCIHQYAPLDAYNWCQRFISYWRPDCSLFFESELWPNLIKVAHDHGIKMALVNARLSDKSLNNWRRFPKTIARILRQFSTIIAQSEDDCKKIQGFTDGCVYYFGNLKHSSDSLPVNQETFNCIRSKVGDKVIFVAASTHKGEEELIISAYNRLKEKHNIFTILAPRHPNRCKDVSALCFEARIKYMRRSQVGNDIQKDTELYVVDTIGELGTFYALADIAFVGGSLVPQGGHNILEPAKLKCSIIYGNYMHNFKELDRLFRNNSAATVVNSATELINSISEQIENMDKRKSMQEAAYKIATSQEKILEEVTDTLSPVLNP